MFKKKKDAKESLQHLVPNDCSAMLCLYYFTNQHGHT